LRDTIDRKGRNTRKKSVFLRKASGPGRSEQKELEEEQRTALETFADLYNFADLRENRPVIDPATGTIPASLARS